MRSESVTVAPRLGRCPRAVERPTSRDGPVEARDEPLAQPGHPRDRLASPGDLGALVDRLHRQVATLLRREHPAARGVAEKTLDYCQRYPDRVPAVVRARALAQVGSCDVVHHDWTRGIRLLWTALDTPATVREVSLLASVFGDLTVAWATLGDVAKALRHGWRARRACERVGETASLARIERELAKIHARAGRPDEAERWLRLARSRGDDHRTPPRGAPLLLASAELNFERRRLSRAWTDALAAAALAERGQARLTLATAMEWLGRVAEEAGDHGEADRRFARALESLATYGARRRQVDCHVRYARLLEVRGASSDALVHYRAAARMASPTGGGWPVE